MSAVGVLIFIRQTTQKLTCLSETNSFVICDFDVGAKHPGRAGHPRFTTSAWAAVLRRRQLLGPGVESLIELRAYMPNVARAGIWEHFPVHHGQLKGPVKLHRRGIAGISV